MFNAVFRGRRGANVNVFTFSLTDSRSQYSFGSLHRPESLCLTLKLFLISTPLITDSYDPSKIAIPPTGARKRAAKIASSHERPSNGSTSTTPIAASETDLTKASVKNVLEEYSRRSQLFSSLGK